MNATLLVLVLIDVCMISNLTFLDDGYIAMHLMLLLFSDLTKLSMQIAGTQEP